MDQAITTARTQHSDILACVGEAPRYLFTVDYIFTRNNKSADAFPKENFATGWHVQEFYEINIVTRGAGYHCIGDRCIAASKGDIFVIPPCLRHAFVGGEGFDVYHFLIAPSLLDNFLPKLRMIPGFLLLFEIEPLMRLHGGDFKHLHLDDAGLGEICATLDELYRLTTVNWDMSESARLVSECLAIILITELCRAFSQMQHEGSHEDDFFAASIAQIHEKFNTGLSVDELAATARLSRTAYLARFKELTGLSPKQYILRERIRAAKNLLTHSDRTVASIAEETGFFDTAHFSKCFTAEEGQSPSRFRAATNDRGRTR